MINGIAQIADFVRREDAGKRILISRKHIQEVAAVVLYAARTRHFPGLRAQRDANGHFAPTPQHGIIEHAVEAYARQQKRNRPEEERESCQHVLAEVLRTVDLHPGPEVANSKVGPVARRQSRSRFECRLWPHTNGDHG